MASGSPLRFFGSFAGVADDIEINKCPFRPRVIRFFTANGSWGLKIEDEYNMDGNNYISDSGTDTGVTITDDGCDIANGADINENGHRTYYIMEN